MYGFDLNLTDEQKNMIRKIKADPKRWKKEELRPVSIGNLGGARYGYFGKNFDLILKKVRDEWGYGG
jgi:hypothetical protein